MGINLLFIIAAAILAAGALWGWRRGLLNGIIGIVSCIIGIIVLVILVKGVGSFLQGSIENVVIALFLLIVINLANRIVKLVLGAVKLLRAVPAGRLVDKLAGAAFGVIEAVFVLWLAFFVIGSFDVFGLNQWMMEQVAQSGFLTALYSSNYLVILLQQVM